jgi:Recombinase zinc beta ribbon domain
VCSRLVSSEEWILLRDVHPGYVTWEDYQSNLQRVKSNALSWSSERHRGPAREGTALLQGLVICGTCGERMSVRYHSHRNQSVPTYWCGRRLLQRGENGLCQTVHAERTRCEPSAFRADPKHRAPGTGGLMSTSWEGWLIRFEGLRTLPGSSSIIRCSSSPCEMVADC